MWKLITSSMQLALPSERIVEMVKVASITIWEVNLTSVKAVQVEEHLSDGGYRKHVKTSELVQPFLLLYFCIGRISRHGESNVGGSQVTG